MLRHYRNQHGSGDTPPVPAVEEQPPPPPPVPAVEEQPPPPPVPAVEEQPPPPPVPAVGEQPPPGPFLFRHPFTMIVSGPTSCGKTHFVAEVLREAEAMCEPVPQRIVWLYKRWQPLYDVVRDGVHPPMEFVRGIPADLESDDFFDPRVRNVVVLDDLMTLASKDTRINDLFTEGSHDRNLSVIAIYQNLYFGKDPTQRRNCYYMVLFDNPIDRQPVATLERQMYPGRSEHFLRPRTI